VRSPTTWSIQVLTCDGQSSTKVAATSGNRQ
jgi:hypothetical protein